MAFFTDLKPSRAASFICVSVCLFGPETQQKQHKPYRISHLNKSPISHGLKYLQLKKWNVGFWLGKGRGGGFTWDTKFVWGEKQLLMAKRGSTCMSGVLHIVYNLWGLPATTSLTNQILEMAPQEPPVTTAKKGKGAKLNKYSQLLL